MSCEVLDVLVPGSKLLNAAPKLVPVIKQRVGEETAADTQREECPKGDCDIDQGTAQIIGICSGMQLLCLYQSVIMSVPSTIMTLARTVHLQSRWQSVQFF